MCLLLLAGGMIEMDTRRGSRERRGGSRRTGEKMVRKLTLLREIAVNMVVVVVMATEVKGEEVEVEGGKSETTDETIQTVGIEIGEL